LVGYNRTEKEIQGEIGADWLIYQDLEDLVTASSEGNPEIPGFDCSVFDGDYITGDIDEDYLCHLETERADHAKAARERALTESSNAIVGMHNGE